jgi:hypothetical protein
MGDDDSRLLWLTSFAQLVKEMVAGDLAIAKREVANGKNPFELKGRSTNQNDNS